MMSPDSEVTGVVFLRYSVRQTNKTDYGRTEQNEMEWNGTEFQESTGWVRQR